jgi:hypothetical protein
MTNYLLLSEIWIEHNIKLIKEQYENRTRYLLLRRTYTIIRLDGNAFSRYTSKLEKPFDMRFIEDMNETAKHLCQGIQGTQFAFVQSDEISLLLTDFATEKTCAWFDGNIQTFAIDNPAFSYPVFTNLPFVASCTIVDIQGIQSTRATVVFEYTEQQGAMDQHITFGYYFQGSDTRHAIILELWQG